MFKYAAPLNLSTSLNSFALIKSCHEMEWVFLHIWSSFIKTL